MSRCSEELGGGSVRRKVEGAWKGLAWSFPERRSPVDLIPFSAGWSLCPFHSLDRHTTVLTVKERKPGPRKGRRTCPEPIQAWQGPHAAGPPCPPSTQLSPRRWPSEEMSSQTAPLVGSPPSPAPTPWGQAVSREGGRGEAGELQAPQGPAALQGSLEKSPPHSTEQMQ